MQRYLKYSVCLVLFGVVSSVPRLANAQERVPRIAPIQKEAIDGKVTGARLERILKAGPHALIRSFLVEPAYEGKIFLGFKVVQRTDHPAIGKDALIKVGDIVVSANGVRLETPAQFMSAWRKLREQKVFVVDVLRAQQKVRYRWTLAE